MALSLVCSLCFEERGASRSMCPGCSIMDDRSVAVFAAPEIPHLEVRACNTCRRYLILVRLDREPAAVPEVDEMAAMSLDLRARELGYEKIQTNLVGL